MSDTSGASRGLSQLGIQLSISAQVMISRFVGWSPTHSGLWAGQGACLGFSLSPSLSAPPLLVISLSLKISKINIKKCLALGTPGWLHH